MIFGVNLVYIRDLLGHISIQTTDIYARADSKAKRDALEKAYTDLTPSKSSDKGFRGQVPPTLQNMTRQLLLQKRMSLITPSSEPSLRRSLPSETGTK